MKKAIEMFGLMSSEQRVARRIVGEETRPGWPCPKYGCSSPYRSGRQEPYLLGEEYSRRVNKSEVDMYGNLMKRIESSSQIRYLNIQCQSNTLRKGKSSLGKCQDANSTSGLLCDPGSRHSMKVRREDGCKCVMRSRIDNLGVDLKIDDTRS
jgi:hypothetical protein